MENSTITRLEFDNRFNDVTWKLEEGETLLWDVYEKYFTNDKLDTETEKELFARHYSSISKLLHMAASVVFDCSKELNLLLDSTVIEKRPAANCEFEKALESAINDIMENTGNEIISGLEESASIAWALYSTADSIPCDSATHDDYNNVLNVATVLTEKLNDLTEKAIQAQCTASRLLGAPEAAANE